MGRAERDDTELGLASASRLEHRIDRGTRAARPDVHAAGTTSGRITPARPGTQAGAPRTAERYWLSICAFCSRPE